jgi:hypothetical protein
LDNGYFEFGISRQEIILFQALHPAVPCERPGETGMDVWPGPGAVLMQKSTSTMPPLFAALVRVTLIASVLCLARAPVLYGEGPILPAPSYKKDELPTLREWEKNWAGKEIDASNVDQVADYLPEIYRETIKNPEKWGKKPMWFRIVPYRQLVPTRGFAEATRKNAGKIKMDEQMVPVGYADMAGFPFPEPKTGWEIAWNYDFSNRGDSLDYMLEGIKVDPPTGLDGVSMVRDWDLWFVSRTEAPPKPRIPDKDNPRGLRKVSVSHFEHPQNMAGSRIMNYRYLDFNKDDETYMWMSEFRRVRRMVASQKVSTQPGSERTQEDRDGFSNHIIVNDYALLGRQERLVARHSDPNQWTRVPGQFLWSGVQRERVKTYVVEAVPKDPTHIYSKRIWYVDPEDFFIKWTECYDLEGKLWRVHEYQYGPYENVNGEPVSFLVGEADLDQKEMAPATTVHKNPTISGFIDPSFFTLQGIRRGGY